MNTLAQFSLAWPQWNALAMSDAWVIGMWITNLVLNALTAAALAYLADRTRKFESLEAQLKETASGLIDARIAGVEERFQVGLKVMNTVITEIQKRLERTDSAFEVLVEKRERLHLEMMERLAELKGFVQLTCVCRDDFILFRKEVQEQGRRLSEQIDQIPRHVNSARRVS